MNPGAAIPRPAPPSPTAVTRPSSIATSPGTRRPVDERGCDSKPHDSSAFRTTPWARSSRSRAASASIPARSETIATFASPPGARSASSTRSSGSAVANPTIRRTRPWSFSFVATDVDHQVAERLPDPDGSTVGLGDARLVGAGRAARRGNWVTVGNRNMLRYRARTSCPQADLEAGSSIGQRQDHLRAHWQSPELARRAVAQGSPADQSASPRSTSGRPVSRGPLEVKRRQAGPVTEPRPVFSSAPGQAPQNPRLASRASSAASSRSSA